MKIGRKVWLKLYLDRQNFKSLKCQIINYLSLVNQFLFFDESHLIVFSQTWSLVFIPFFNPLSCTLLQLAKQICMYMYIVHFSFCFL